MKRIKLILTGVAVVLLLIACSNIGSSKTSLVTITIGSDKVAAIEIQRATVWAKLKNFLAENVHVSTASAAVPGNVLSIRVAVTAPDLPTISQVVDVAGSSVTIILEVPNGFNREFTITGFDTIGGAGNITYWGGTTIDLSGGTVSLSLQMLNLGSVNGFLFVSTSGNDTTGTGTEQNPFRTITNALAVATIGNGHVAIFVGPGTYDTINPAALETFPFQLPTNTALVCLGANNSTVIASNGDGVYGGNTLNSVQYCTVQVCNAIGISDSTLVGGPPSPMLINHVLFPDDPICGGGPGDAIILGADSTVVDTVIQDPFTSGITVNGGNPIIKNNAITGGPLTQGFYGIHVAAGSPSISNSTINGFFFDGSGLGVQIDGGNSTVSQCMMSGNGGGIGISGGSPTITGNTITNSSNAGGIRISGGAPTITGNMINNGVYGIYMSSATTVTATISSNSIDHNSYGVYGQSVGSSSIHNNSIFCNIILDFYLADPTASGFDLTSNAWDHDAATLITGPTITADPTGFAGGCPPGVDICYYNVISQPTYSPFNAAVPGGCL